tara:strand:- start:180 stop:413 length:234 start_codon:yes stop_codon:yes gene_type:complete
MQGQVPDLSNVDLSKATPMRCEKCEGATFKQTLMLHKLSSLVSPNGQETIIPAAVFACEKCGHVNSEFTETSSIATP